MNKVSQNSEARIYLGLEQEVSDPIVQNKNKTLIDMAI
jgi:hypothetical protein